MNDSMPAPDPREDQVVVGRVTRNHGLDGTLRIRSYSDNPRRFQPGDVLTIADAELTVTAFKALPDEYGLLNVEGLTSVLLTRHLMGHWIYAAIEKAPDLVPGEYYHYQLLGLSVTTDQGERLGEISEVLATGSNDVYVVKSNNGDEILLPALQQVVKDIDLAAGEMLVHLIPGLR